ncbi:MAG: peptidyl-alpha-hydroxyglycine alpha-amidating lyase family protein [Acidobacteria bacterium]|nr:peptidyl-alpha-hydroxyglycine alpha-amidating lyase family protein [Acidobacteriota bacterium]
MTVSNQLNTVIVGTGKFTYEALSQWEQLPPGWSFAEVVAVATDSQDRVYVFNRGKHPVMVFDRDGRFLSSWGEGLFVRPHGILIGPDDAVYCADDHDHTVRKFTTGGQLLLTLGTRGQPSDTGVVHNDYRSIRRGGAPFNLPTNLALSPTSEMYVTDGYGNARVHKFSDDGRLLFSWGEPGSGPGQFNLPHGIAVGRDQTVYVADRENSRIQVFTHAGEFLTDWKDVARPTQIFIDAHDNVYVSELGWRAGLFSGVQPPPDPPGGRVSIFTRDGKLLARWGGGDTPCAVGDFFAPHDVWLDSRGDLYISEVTMSAGGNRGVVPSHCHTLQKFVRRSF